MTDRVRALTVVLDQDTRTDDVEHLVAAISMMRGVAHVEHDDHIADLNDWTARQRVRNEVADGILGILKCLREGQAFTVVAEEPSKT